MEDLWKLLKSKGGKTVDFFPLMRLLLPQLDLERGGYGVKEKKIGEMYIKAIPLPSGSPQAKKLQHYKNPKYAGLQVGDFTNCLYHILQHRCITESNKTIKDVNDDLYKLQKECTNQQLKVKWFQKLMTSYTAKEQKWLIRIILKDLKCGVRHESCLKAFHPQALDTYNMTSSLQKVCDIISNPNSILTSSGNLQIELFHPIKPMLAQRRHWKQVVDSMKGSPFGIEIKFDGERVMIHYRKNDKIMLWSRNCIDLEKKYGYVKAFENVIKDQFICNSCILDGEMMAWDNDLKSFIPFGSNRTVVQQHNEQQNHKQHQHLCYMAFDILMINDEIVMDLTLSRRRKLLTDFAVFKPKKTYLEITKMITGINDTKGIMEALDNALQDHHEGIMVKSLESDYKCNKRGGEWIKLKPDYVDDMISSLDLLIMGGYFGEGKRRVGDISHFLLGCKGNNDNDNDDDNDKLPTEFYTFCKVGSGYNIEELKQLQNELRPHWKPFKRNAIPSHFMGWQPQPDDLPDVWIEPKNSLIIELLANEIVTTKNDKFHAGLTVRFPRCKHFRYDKPWHQCISLKEIKDKFNNKKQHHHARTAAEIAILMQDDNIQPRKKRKISSRNVPTIMDQFCPADISNIEIKSNIFQNLEFCVLNGMEQINDNLDDEQNDDYLKKYNKKELEKLIVANGGIITQNPMLQSTNHLIAERMTTRVSNIIGSDISHWNVIRPIWLIHSAENKRLLPFQPTHLLYSTRSTSNLLKQNFDKFGDHFMKPTNIDDLKACFRKMNRNKININKDKINKNGINWLKPEWGIDDEEEMMLIGGYNRFKRCNIYIDYYEPLNIDQTRNGKLKLSSSLRMIESRLKLYGATISKYLDVNVTHIVVDNDDKPRPRLKKINQRISEMMNDINYKWRPYLITAKWVQDSIKSTLVSEDYHKYAPRKLSFPQ